MALDHKLKKTDLVNRRFVLNGIKCNEKYDNSAHILASTTTN